jgi:hypothetical protein
MSWKLCILLLIIFSFALIEMNRPDIAKKVINIIWEACEGFKLAITS